MQSGASHFASVGLPIPHIRSAVARCYPVTLRGNEMPTAPRGSRGIRGCILRPGKVCRNCLSSALNGERTGATLELRMQWMEGLEREISKACLLLRVPHRSVEETLQRLPQHACSVTRPAAGQLTSPSFSRVYVPRAAGVMCSL